MSLKHNILAIDFDGVIAESDLAKVNFARNVLGLDVTEQVMKKRYFVEMFGEEQGDMLYAEIIQNIYRSEKMLEVSMRPFSREGISKLCTAGWTCMIVTSRSGSLREKNTSAYWAWRFLLANGYKIEQRNFISVGKESKVEVCLELNAHGLVDDDYSKILPVVDAGLQGYLFSSQTNKNAETESPAFRGIRVKDWEHLTGMLLQVDNAETNPADSLAFFL